MQKLFNIVKHAIIYVGLDVLPCLYFVAEKAIGPTIKHNKTAHII